MTILIIALGLGAAGCATGILALALASAAGKPTPPIDKERLDAAIDDQRAAYLSAIASWELPVSCPEHGTQPTQFSVSEGWAGVGFECGCTRETPGIWRELPRLRPVTERFWETLEWKDGTE
ncbi:MAG: hypothetical protein ABFE13_11880 [Phycisphaerales bacterium]